MKCCEYGPWAQCHKTFFVANIFFLSAKIFAMYPNVCINYALKDLRKNYIFERKIWRRNVTRKRIVLKVSKWDSLVVQSADFYFSNINNLKCTLALYLYWNGKKGKQANNERYRERESASVGALRKNELGVRHKANRWEKPSWPVFGISHEGLVISGKLF
jgi:hypothetical protein